MDAYVKGEGKGKSVWQVQQQRAENEFVPSQAAREGTARPVWGNANKFICHCQGAATSPLGSVQSVQKPETHKKLPTNQREKWNHKLRLRWRGRVVVGAGRKGKATVGCCCQREGRGTTRTIQSPPHTESSEEEEDVGGIRLKTDIYVQRDGDTIGEWERQDGHFWEQTGGRRKWWGR